MSKVPSALRNKLLSMVVGFAAAAGGYMALDQPSREVQLAMEIGAHYESSGRHIGTPYVDRLGKGQPLTVCNGVTGPEVIAGRYYSREDCKRLELPKYQASERAARRLFYRWADYNVWVRASFIDMIYNLGEGAVSGSTMRSLANAGNLNAACQQMPRWVRGTVNGQSVVLPGLIDRRGTSAELCAEWGKSGHFSSAQLRAAQIEEATNVRD